MIFLKKFKPFLNRFLDRAKLSFKLNFTFTKPQINQPTKIISEVIYQFLVLTFMYACSN
jgi:hypothetical protein